MPQLIASIKCLAAFGLPLLMGAPSMALAQPPKADIIMHVVGHQLTIEDAIRVTEAGDYKVQLEVRKMGESGTATTRQGNRIKAEADRVYQTSQLHFILVAKDHIEAKLSLFSDDTLLVTKTRSYTFGAPAPDTNKQL